MNVLIVEARYHPEITDALVDGATAALGLAGAHFERAAVPGVLEIPPAIAIAARAGRYDGYIALGSVVRDAYSDMIAQETTAGLMRLATDHGLCIGHGLVLALDEDEALGRARDGDVGGDAARACLSLLALQSRLGLS
jgi:6,7-dimethyl-8-ribityllumazine synthase